MAITWLIGKSNNVDMLWSAYDNEIVNSPNTVRNTNLFEEKKYKYNYNKKDQNFLKLKKNSQCELIIKGLAKFDDSIMNENTDKIIHVDNLNKKELFKLYCDITKTSFSEHEIKFINQLTSLEDLCTAVTLKNLNLETKNWKMFFAKEKANWYQQHKNNQLILTGIFNPNQTISVMIYLINANAKQNSILLFLYAKIKQEYQIWEFNKFWKSCVQYL